MEGPFTLVDPLRCADARLAKLARLRPDAHDPLRRQVAHMIEASPDANPQVQSLSITLREHGLLGGGASFPVSPRQPALQTGVVVFSGSGCKRRRCSPIFSAGIAAPATAYMTLAPAPQATTHERHVRRRIAVVQGFFAFTVPRDTGPEVLTGCARDGRELSFSFLPPGRTVPHERLSEKRHSAPTE